MQAVANLASERWTLTFSTFITESSKASCSSDNMTVHFRFYEFFDSLRLSFEFFGRLNAFATSTLSLCLRNKCLDIF